MTKAKNKKTSDISAKSELSIEELENSWKRALADYKNLEKRVEEDRKQYVLFANEIILRQLLPVLDNLESLYEHLKDDGLQYIIKDFRSILKNAGIEEIEVKEENPFDSSLMDCFETVECDKHLGSVHKVIKKGYKLKNKLLRPAVVTACKLKKE